jgi:ribosomal-protein-alanine N-acetyltransferase
MKLACEKENVYLRSLQHTDAAPISILLDNKKIWDNLRDYLPQPYRIQDAEFFIQHVSAELPPLTFAICQDKDLCGIISLKPQSDIHRASAELGYWVGEIFWGKGLATEAVRCICRYAFDDLGFVRLFAGVMEHNVASMRVLEKSGFSKEGILRKAILKNERYLDEHLYASIHPAIS